MRAEFLPRPSAVLRVLHLPNARCPTAQGSNGGGTVSAFFGRTETEVFQEPVERGVKSVSE